MMGRKDRRFIIGFFSPFWLAPLSLLIFSLSLSLIVYLVLRFGSPWISSPFLLPFVKEIEKKEKRRRRRKKKRMSVKISSPDCLPTGNLSVSM